MYILCTLLIRPGKIHKSVAGSLFAMNNLTITNVYLDLSLLLRKMFIKNILLQISFCALTLQVNVTIFSTKFEG